MLPIHRTLSMALQHVNAARHGPKSARRGELAAALILLAEAPGRSPADVLDERVERALGRPTRRLAAYGSLRPGESNHGLVADLGEHWTPGWVRGELHPAVNTDTGGYPVLKVDPRGPRQAVQVLESGALPARWHQLDAFEGASYRRVLVVVEDDADGASVANLYALAP